MSSENTKRKLVAILAADVVGYSQAMSENEEHTLHLLNERLTIFKLLIPQYHGRIFGGAGDSIIAEFPSAVEALRCSLKIQHALTEQNSESFKADQMQFRIGISVGDVIDEGNNLMGEFVNIAARLESIAEPDGITVSGDVYRQVRNKVDAEYKNLGPLRLKNIPEAVIAYRVTTNRPAVSVETNSDLALGSKRIQRKSTITSVVSVLVILALVFIFYLVNNRPPSTVIPSIAVLPFANMSDDPNQDYFTDGISQDIITDLSRLSNLKVIAWNTTTRYRDDLTDPHTVGNKLGVEYILSGSVRKAGEKLRITAQFVDTQSGNNLWAERFDRKLTEVFAVQDEVTRKIVKILALKLTETEKSTLGHASTSDFAAYDAFLKGQQLSLQRTAEANERARNAFRQAIELDPEYARAYGALAVAITRDYRNAWRDIRPEEARARSLKLAQKAVELDQSSPQVYWSLGYVHLHRGEYNQAEEAARKAINIAPNFADGYALLGLINNYRGQAAIAMHDIQTAMSLNPHYTHQYPYNLGRSYYTMGRYPEAIAALKESLALNENSQYPRLFLAASYIRLGQIDDAKWEVEQVEMLNPGTTLSHLAGTFPILDQEEMENFLKDLRDAGLPE